MKIYDISIPLEEGVPAWPGDVPFSRTQSMFLGQGDSVNLSAITTSLHNGSHADAPLHYLPGGTAVDRMELEPFWGPARLVSVEAAQAIEPHHLESVLRNPPQRLLVRCNPARPRERFEETFVYFSEGAARAIAEAGISLVGTDGPSVDRFDSRSLPAHHALGSGKTVILENLCFAGVPDGEYTLLALPLRIRGADASPVRAVLRVTGG